MTALTRPTCIEQVALGNQGFDRFRHKPCGRAAGHGPDGNHCRRHGEKRMPGYKSLSDMRYEADCAERAVVDRCVVLCAGRTDDALLNGYRETLKAAQDALRERKS